MVLAVESCWWVNEESMMDKDVTEAILVLFRILVLFHGSSLIFYGVKNRPWRLLYP